MLGNALVVLHGLLTWCAYAASLVVLGVYLSRRKRDESLRRHLVVPSVLFGCVITGGLLFFVTVTGRYYTTTYHGFPAIVTAVPTVGNMWSLVPNWPRHWALLPAARLVPVKGDRGSLPGLLANVILWSALAHRFYKKG